MTSPRAAHTATTLADGRVLLVGGMSGDDRTTEAPAELYDPAAGTLVLAPAISSTRQSHSATLLPDGRVLIAGGYGPGGEYLAEAELFDPATGGVMAVGPMTVERAGHAAVSLADGRVLIVGGVGRGWTFLASSEIFDPTTDAFIPTGSMSVPRESHVVLTLADGRVLVVGGHRGRRADIELFASIEVFDPVSGRFSDGGAMLVPRHKHDAVLLPGGQVLITGGADERDSEGVFASVERYDPESGTSAGMPALLLPRYKHRGSSVLLPDGRVLIAGGAGQAEIYDPSGSRSALVAGGPLSGQFSAVARLDSGEMLITGGYRIGSPPRREVWRYRP